MTKKAPIFDQGIEITKPWSNAMYAHNDIVKDLQIKAITVAFNKAIADDDMGTVEYIMKALCAYSQTFDDCEEAVEEFDTARSQVQTFWLKQDAWPDMLAAGLVTPLSMEYVGYGK